VSSGERFLAADGSSAQPEYTGDLPRPNRIEANPFPQSYCTVAPMPTEMADGRDAWRYAGESWPLDGRPKGNLPRTLADFPRLHTQMGMERSRLTA
jgi:hypothetical protein